MQETSNSIKKSPNPCKECRHRHLKCDFDTPACANCRKSNAECIRGLSVRFRHSLNPSVRSQRAPELARLDFTFNHDQPWVKTNRSLSFVDETPDLVNLYDPKTTNLENVENANIAPRPGSHQLSPQVYGAGLPSSPSSLPSISSEPLRTDFDSSLWDKDQHPRKRRTLSSYSYSGGGSFRTTSRSALGHLRALTHGNRRDRPKSTDGILFTSSQSPSLAQGSLCSDVNEHTPLEAEGLDTSKTSTPQHSIAETLSGIYLDTPKWPLEDRQEALLFRYFIEELASHFDMCDSERHFATVVPRRAVFCAPLMNAILATSARRLSRITDFDGDSAHQYHQNCLNALIPALSSSEAVMDENLLTAIIILRFMEELDVPVASSKAAESHLLGIRVFIEAQGKAGDFTGLRLAAFWVALRQEIHIAFIQARPVHPVFENVARAIQTDDVECAFANKIIIQCASCIRYCYSAEEQSVAGWERLKKIQEQWWEERPWNFHPLFSQDVGEGLFPEEMYLNDAVVTGVQHYYMSQMLLEAHNPNIPKLGPGQAVACRTADENIKQTVRLICGIAQANPRTGPAYVNAYLAVTMAGDRFTNAREQQLLYDILIKIDGEYGWPTRSTQQYLRQAWGWPEPSISAMPLSDMLNTNR